MSSEYSFQDSYKNATPEQKLAILRAEMIMPISKIRGYAAIIKQRVNPEAVQGLPDGFDIWIDRIVEAGDRLKELEALARL